ncbi:zinc ribbon domain-containing protein [Geosporobacter ferrireducens]|uniref:DZANK-type domain-containing protein n=1 Tax=Geosporobacter ferrireducens TaxID=1424294 RepID=A0A1D8GE14_9FIRM|nr:zinc ribbon domain-containing protein [Geosporobacter ferrireducens]AOT69154.1 hypothetical protein Gferi_06010 [Geosporobacter ferrireducens]MTI56831.1 zinc ribbon domain-containing protein [Geosporobacter ferrireducens]
MEKQQKMQKSFLPNVCTNCGEMLQEDWSFCPFCNKKVEKKACKFCEMELRASWSYCPYCSKNQNETDKHKYEYGNEWLREILNNNNDH